MFKTGVHDMDASYVGFGARAAAWEDEGYDTIGMDETKADAFVRASVAVQNTRRVEVMTGVAIAFARNPMTVAYAANDLQALSDGRFHLGLGSQVKPHITRRFSMPWSHPAARMKEFIDALNAIWDCWYDAKPLKFEGEFYRHTLMTPMFTPHDRPAVRPRVHLAAVGPLMTKAAGESADGLMIHSFTTEAYLRDVTLPNLAQALAARGRARTDFEISGGPFIVTGLTEEAMAAADRATRKQIAFYGSTPAYLPVLEHHGWGEAAKVLHAMSLEGKWDAMADIIDDTMLRAFAVVGEPDQVIAQFRDRFAGLYDRISLRAGVLGSALSARIAAGLRAPG